MWEELNEDAGGGGGGVHSEASVGFEFSNKIVTRERWKHGTPRGTPLVSSSTCCDARRKPDLMSSVGILSRLKVDAGNGDRTIS